MLFAWLIKTFSFQCFLKSYFNYLMLLELWTNEYNFDRKMSSSIRTMCMCINLLGGDYTHYNIKRNCRAQLECSELNCWELIELLQTMNITDIWCRQPPSVTWLGTTTVMVSTIYNEARGWSEMKWNRYVTFSEKINEKVSWIVSVLSSVSFSAKSLIYQKRKCNLKFIRILCNK